MSNQSDTPRTDDKAYPQMDTFGQTVPADFARQLEREVNQLKTPVPEVRKWFAPWDGNVQFDDSHIALCENYCHRLARERDALAAKLDKAMKCVEAAEEMRHTTEDGEVVAYFDKALRELEEVKPAMKCRSCEQPAAEFYDGMCIICCGKEIENLRADYKKLEESK